LSASGQDRIETWKTRWALNFERCAGLLSQLSTKAFDGQQIHSQCTANHFRFVSRLENEAVLTGCRRVSSSGNKGMPHCEKKLLIVLGAGSSIDQGMPSVADLDGHMKTWSEEWLRCDFGMPPNIENYFTTLWSRKKNIIKTNFYLIRSSQILSESLAI
jgi:hypothetical protein